MEGQNSVASGELRSFIERIERVREEKKALGEDEKFLFAEAKAKGLQAATMRDVLKIRQMKPADREEAESMLGMYLHAMGMAKEAPLFRGVGLMNVDTAARDQVIDAFKLLAPTQGEVIVKAGGAPVRIWRDKDGDVQVEDYHEPESSAAPSEFRQSKIERDPPPDCTEEEAIELGMQAAKDNQPVVTNPFPWDDPRRPLWDEGWRSAAGSDGMGPRGDDD